MRILYVTTIGSTMSFFKPFIRQLLDQGDCVDILANDTVRKVPDDYREWGCNIYPLSCVRSPLNIRNLIAILEIKKIVGRNCYDIVHCHTPVAAMCTRLACIGARKRGTKVFYTAHGFHFFKGAPLKNWLLYYPVEKICSYFTDVLITINREDYQLARKKMKASRVEYVPGVGVDVEKFRNIRVDREQKRAELGIPEEATMLLSVGELNQNKNQQVIIRALAQLKNHDIHYAVVGIGDQLDALKNLARELGVAQQVHFLGYRQDVAELYHVADVFCHPSFREGLPVSVIEAMACSLPCVVSQIRGNVDLVDVDGGILFNPFSVENCAQAIRSVMQKDLSVMGRYNQEKSKEYNIDNIEIKMKEIYQM